MKTQSTEIDNRKDELSSIVADLQPSWVIFISFFDQIENLETLVQKALWRRRFWRHYPGLEVNNDNLRNNVDCKIYNSSLYMYYTTIVVIFFKIWRCEIIISRILFHITYYYLIGGHILGCIEAHVASECLACSMFDI